MNTLILLACAPLVLGLTARQSSSTITVDLTKTYQTIEGFGFSEAFQRANELHNLSSSDQKTVLDLLFNTTNGAGFSIIRNGIGSSPNSTADHMVSIEPTSPGAPNAAPKYVWDGDDSNQLWLSQQAMKYGVTTIYANAWSAPGYMKTNNDDANGGYLCGLPNATCSSGDWRQTYADYLVQYIKYYQQAGVPITHLGFINEPDQVTAYASMEITGQQVADFVKVLYPTLKAANLSVGITCCDSSGWALSRQFAANLTAAGVDSMVSTITSHGYTSVPDTPINTTHPVWMTEWADLSGNWSTAWYTTGIKGDGHTWATRIHTALTQANTTAYFWWVATQNLTQDGTINEELISVNPDNSFTVSKRLWAYAQFSRYIRPGAVRVSAAVDPASNILASAYRNVNGALVIPVINNGTTAATISIKGVTGTKVTAWLSDNDHDMDLAAAQIGTDGSLGGSISGKSMVTYVIS